MIVLPASKQTRTAPGRPSCRPRRTWPAPARPGARPWRAEKEATARPTRRLRDLAASSPMMATAAALPGLEAACLRVGIAESRRRWLGRRRRRRSIWRASARASPRRHGAGGTAAAAEREAWLLEKERERKRKWIARKCLWLDDVGGKAVCFFLHFFVENASRKQEKKTIKAPSARRRDYDGEFLFSPRFDRIQR